MGCPANIVIGVDYKYSYIRESTPSFDAMWGYGFLSPWLLQVHFVMVAYIGSVPSSLKCGPCIYNIDGSALTKLYREENPN